MLFRSLGKFRLENIRPAPRGVPQIEVTLDIDANGILNVTAKDRDTGAEQRITISGSSNLDTAEVDRMVSDAEAHRTDDASARELIDARNELDSVMYQIVKRVEQGADAVPTHEKARADMLVGDAQQALADQSTPLDRLRTLTADLQQAGQSLASSTSAPQGSAGGGEPSTGGSAPADGSDGDDVIDAEFTAG